MEVSQIPLVLKGAVSIQGRAGWEQEIEPWFIYTRTVKVDGKLTETKKVVDPPKFMDRIPDHDDRLSANDIPSTFRQRTASLWVPLSLAESSTQDVMWELDSVPELFGKEPIAGKAALDPNGYFSIDLPEVVVRALHTMESPFIRLTVRASGKPSEVTKIAVLQRSVFNEAMDLRFASTEGDSAYSPKRNRPSVAPHLPPGSPLTAEWGEKPELNEVPTGRKRSEVALASSPARQLKQVFWPGTARFEHEIAPWHVYRLVEQYSIAGKMVRFERKIVDPPEYRDLIPDYDPFKGPQAIPEDIRISADPFWRKFTPKEVSESFISWSVAGDAEALLDRRVSGRSGVSITGQFQLEFSKDDVLKLSTLACDTIDVRFSAEKVDGKEFVQKIPRQLFVDASLAD